MNTGFRCALAVSAALLALSVPVLGWTQDAFARPALTPYEEYFCYSPVAARSYVPGYVPKTASLWENPKTRPAALWDLGNPYTYRRLLGDFFCSPQGYQTSVPEDSIAWKYETGMLGITSNLAHGYPEGQRVVEPVIIPWAQYTKRGGVYIDAGSDPLRVASGTQASGMDGGDGAGAGADRAQSRSERTVTPEK
jgi:hypothetical protein